jgi:replicative DNA helicase
MKPDHQISILSWCINEPLYIDKLIEKGLREEHFTQGRHKALWRVLTLGVGVGKGDGFFDLLAAFTALPEASKKEWGTVSELAKLIDSPFRDISGELMLHNAGHLISQAKKNRVLAKVKSAYLEMEGADDWEKVWAQLELELGNLNRNTGPTLKHAADLLQSLLTFEDEKEPIKVRTGIPTLDESFENPDGKVIYLGARTGIGKSALAQQIAIETAEVGTPVAIFSYEMTEKENSARLGQYCAKIRGDRVLKPKEWSKEEYSRAFNAVESVKKRELYIESDKTKSFEEILGDIRRLKRVKNIQVVFIDYLTLLKSSVKSFSRREELERMCTELQTFVKEMGICCFVLAQLNRDVKNTNDRPNLTHFKDTGQIEQSADIAMLLSRVDDDSTRMLVDFAKVRFGKRREVYLSCEPETLTYKEGHPPQAPLGPEADAFEKYNKLWD